MNTQDLSNKNIKLANKKSRSWEWHTKKSASYDPNMVFGDLKDADGDPEGFWLFSAGNNKPRWMIEEEKKGKIPVSVQTHQQKADRVVEEKQMESARKEFAKTKKQINGRGFVTTNRLVAQIAKSEGFRVSQNGTKFKIKK